ncbi:5912_t:CDS:1, partial [Acaulospora morrowiae]
MENENSGEINLDGQYEHSVGGMLAISKKGYEFANAFSSFVP